MTIKILTRFCPFSHISPVFTLIPRTFYGAEITPSFIRIRDMLENSVILEKRLGAGPLEQFTVTLDLERERVELSGFSTHGFIRYKITNGKIICDKGEREEFSFSEEKWSQNHVSKLFLGSNKAQNVEHMFQRGQLSELLPHLFLLAQMVPGVKDIAAAPGTLLFLAESDPCYENLKNLIRAGFKSLFYPRLFDDSYLGFAPICGSVENQSPLLLLQKLYPLLVGLFFKEEESAWHILPKLPKEFPVGRLAGFTTQKGHQVSIEWTKKSIRQLEIRASSDDCLILKFSPEIKRFRLTEEMSSCSKNITNGTEISFTKGSRYYLDRFER